jgi:hypothetical protein
MADNPSVVAPNGLATLNLHSDHRTRGVVSLAVGGGNRRPSNRPVSVASGGVLLGPRDAELRVVVGAGRRCRAILAADCRSVGGRAGPVPTRFGCLLQLTYSREPAGSWPACHRRGAWCDRGAAHWIAPSRVVGEGLVGPRVCLSTGLNRSVRAGGRPWPVPEVARCQPQKCA